MSIHTHYKIAKQLVNLMDTRFSVFGIKFGLDPLLDLIPWFGSILGAVISLYLFYLAYKLNVPSWVYFRITWNIILDFLLGEIPYAGIIFDTFYRSNVKNFALIQRFYDPDVLEGEIIEE